MRLMIRVQPGAGRTAVGRRREDPLHGPLLVVRVTEPAVDGRATEAALRALCAALRVRRGDVRLVRGATSRVKAVEVEVAPVDEPALRIRIDELGRDG
ncbi:MULTISPECIES: DUF167 domain-containing protein [unclassified Frankia]